MSDGFIDTIWCEHCQMLSLLEYARACRCGISPKHHVACRDCASKIDPEMLGTIVEVEFG